MSADSDVSTMVAGNKMNSSTTQTYSCNYVYYMQQRRGHLHDRSPRRSNRRQGDGE